MRADSVQICHYKSGNPQGQFLELLRFVKNELRAIGAAAMEEHQGAIWKLAEDGVQALEELRNKAIKCKDPSEPFPSEPDAKLSNIAEHAMFELAVKRHWEWLYENWRTVLPKN
jgi:hypothetical protein